MKLAVTNKFSSFALTRRITNNQGYKFFYRPVGLSENIALYDRANVYRSLAWQFGLI